MKKAIVKILKWVLLFTYMFFMLSFVNKKSENVICVQKNIKIDQPYKFVTKESVDKMLLENDIKLDSAIIDKTTFNKIEKILEDNPYVDNADVFSTFSGELDIRIEQKKPVMRIITENNVSYYLDKSFSLIPVSDEYTANIIVVTGHISYSFINSNIKNHKSIDRTYPYTIKELYDFANFINEHKLWKNQIEQIYINENKEIELVPRVGNHIIILGDLKKYKYKMGKLEAIYKKGFILTDWNIYSTINLKYSNQVICKKR